MTALAWLIPCALFLGLLALAAFLWALAAGQFEDLDGAGWRAILDDEPAVRPDQRTGPDAVVQDRRLGGSSRA